MRFDRFVGIDWSGAVGSRHPSVQVAMCAAGDAAPQLVLPPGGIWSRTGVLGWLTELSGDVLVGMDAGFGFAAVPPFLAPARTLWAEIDAACAADIDLGGHSFIAQRREAFWLGAADGPRHLRAHLRVTEQVYAASRLGTPTSNFVLLGASQVGKATLSAMRLLNRLDWPVWPFDPVPATGPLILEIYAQAFARMGGARGKLRDRSALDAVLVRLGSLPTPVAFPATFPDHVGDAMITAAGLRAIAGAPHWWAPPAMTPAIAATEGWTFGVA
ncbi:hypothetical protein [Polymorphobacter fuscus]|uniref:DUF429 domain-containing protein n=1 Tax=Sandarakinorhabdus fusca TaxID=1439888 RepID=A0A7C9KJ37_9SPHN|nr:hypothetical protein [Polymorphobacter fuscus]KAB7646532.1 hypothetical protein F9290_10980 [Polymorphobacter fuscus]MQT17779.1 hypothetical protein [Polymorphobacter fuscus]NJC09673.1 hypothetical protein [Polymorphobacter fuscus]